MRAPLPLPERIGGRYKVTRLLGKGGMGMVYEAFADGVPGQQGTRVAVKVITAEMAKDPVLMGRFEREVRAAASLDTPHIPRVLDAGTDPASGLPFLVLEFLDGQDLQQILKRIAPLTPDLALRITAQACRALEKAHDSRIVHRDIKPANFFLAKEHGARVVKLLDFGIAKVKRGATMAGSSGGLTQTGSMLGSPLYMSPEQARGHKDIDERADLWSLGVVLYQALTGKTPHADTEELGELIVLICTEPAKPVQEVAPWVKPEVAAVVHKLLRFEPGERYQTAEELRRAIEKLLPPGAAVISEDMIRPLREDERAMVAPRIEDVTTMPGRAVVPAAQPTPMPAPSVLQAPPAPVSSPGAQYAAQQQYAQPQYAQQQYAQQQYAQPQHAAQPIIAPVIGPPQGESVGGVVQTAIGPSPIKPSRTRAIVIAAVLVVTIAGGLGAFQLSRMSGKDATPMASASASSSPKPADTRPRAVKLVVIPADAEVTVDGAKATAQDGLVEIEGTLGSVHKVRVSSGGAERTADVVVTENGAVPPKIELPRVATSATAPPPKPTGYLPRPAPAPVIRPDR